MCARFLSHLLLLYIGRVHGAISGCTVLWEVHPASAQNISLIFRTLPCFEFQNKGDSRPRHLEGKGCKQYCLDRQTWLFPLFGPM